MKRQVLSNLILPSGILKLDSLLGRGIQTGLTTHVYGEAGVGKTTFALTFVKSALDLGGRVVYINSEGSSPVERLEQIMQKEYKELANKITLLLPKNFDEQNTIIEDLELIIKDDTRLVVIDTLTRLYRTTLDDKRTNYAAHRELNRQMGFLKGLAKHKDVAVIVLNQVRAKMDEPNGIEPVASGIMDYWSNYVICLRAKQEVGARIVNRLSPEGDPSSVIVYITPEGFAAEKAQEKQ